MNLFKNIARHFPGIAALISERDKLKNEVAEWKKGFVPPGHYYSPIPNIDEIKPRLEKHKTLTEIPGIDLNTEGQLSLLEVFASFHKEIPFTEEPQHGKRYHLNNDFYAYSDGACLYSMLRHLKPKKIIEVGSGFSSAACLDTYDSMPDNDIEFTFIDPYPERLESLLTDIDKKNPKISIISMMVQDIQLSRFNSLQAGDVLFIDSSHVAKSQSDVNFLLFEVLPSLNAGVYIHIHDIFFPFEYPHKWIYAGRAWNEVYLLRAFLQYNSSFEIVFFNSYLESTHNSLVEQKMPLCLKKPRNELTIPGSIWLKKLDSGT